LTEAHIYLSPYSKVRLTESLNLSAIHKTFFKICGWGAV